MFVYLEDAWHYLDDNEHTTCGILVPHETRWERAVPDGETTHCGDARVRGSDTPQPFVNDDKPKPKAKKKG